MPNLSRRNLLQLVGLAGAAYMLPSLARPRAARADNGVPKRLVFFYTEQGTLKQFDNNGVSYFPWAPNAPGAPSATSITTPWSTSAHTLGELHAASLTPFQKKLLFLDGIDMISSTVDPTGAANAHIAGETHALVAANRQTDALAGGISIDQYIAKAINSPTPLTELSSLEMYVDPWGGDNGNEAHPIYSGSGQPVQMSGDAGVIYDRLLPHGPTTNDPAQQAKLAAMLAQQKATLELAKQNFSALGTKAGKLDADRMNAHAQALADLESRLSIGANVACMEPDRATAIAGSNAATKTDPSCAVPADCTYTADLDVAMRLAQLALSCDLTRVLTLYASVPPDAVINYKSVQGTTDFHDMVHKTNGGNPALGSDPTAMGIVKGYHQYMSAQFAKFLGLLDSIVEPNGGTVLDNSIVVWCGQIAAGDHSLDHIPYVLAGSMGGAVKSGRYVRYPRTPNMQRWPVYSDGPAHNDLFVALANLMGVPAKTFGNASVCAGPLAGLT